MKHLLSFIALTTLFSAQTQAAPSTLLFHCSRPGDDENKAYFLDIYAEENGYKGIRHPHCTRCRPQPNVIGFETLVNQPGLFTFYGAQATVQIMENTPGSYGGWLIFPDDEFSTAYHCEKK